jgi:hypothetical protein
MQKNKLTFLLILISGLVIGGLIGETLGGVSVLSWLNYGKQIGLNPPLSLDLSFFTLDLGITLKLNIAGIIGMIISIIVYKKL